MIRRPILPTVAGLALALGGCVGTQNRGLESVHQPVVQRAEYALDLQTAGDGLALGERARLNGWLEALRLGYGDRVSVDETSGAAGAAAEVGGVVAGYGLLLSEDRSVAGPPVQPGVVRVVVSRMRASVPGCPDYSRPPERNADQHTSSNYGCAVNANLAAMVADPTDLVRGRTGAHSIDPAVSGKAIDTFRKAPTTGSAGLKTEKVGK